MFRYYYEDPWESYGAAMFGNETILMKIAAAHGLPPEMAKVYFTFKKNNFHQKVQFWCEFYFCNAFKFMFCFIRIIHLSPIAIITKKTFLYRFLAFYIIFIWWTFYWKGVKFDAKFTFWRLRILFWNKFLSFCFLPNWCLPSEREATILENRNGKICFKTKFASFKKINFISNLHFFFKFINILILICDLEYCNWRGLLDGGLWRGSMLSWWTELLGAWHGRDNIHIRSLLSKTIHNDKIIKLLTVIKKFKFKLVYKTKLQLYTNLIQIYYYTIHVH